MLVVGFVDEGAEFAQDGSLSKDMATGGEDHIQPS